MKIELEITPEIEEWYKKETAVAKLHQNKGKSQILGAIGKAKEKT